MPILHFAQLIEMGMLQREKRPLPQSYMDAVNELHAQLNRFPDVQPFLQLGRERKALRWESDFESVDGTEMKRIEEFVTFN